MTLLASTRDLKARLPPTDEEEYADDDAENYYEGDEADWLDAVAEAEIENPNQPTTKPQASSASGYQLMAVLNAELAELEERREELLEEKEALLAGHSEPVTLDHPAEDDEKVLAELLKDPLLGSMFGRGSSPLSFFSGSATSPGSPVNTDATLANKPAELVGTGKQGVLTGFITRHPKLAGWIERKPKLAFWGSLPVLLLGLFWLLSGISALFDPPIPAQAGSSSGTKTTPGTVTATPSPVAVRATLAATARPLGTVVPSRTTALVVTPTTAPLPSPTPTLADLTGEAHGGYFAPARLNVAAVSFSYSNDKILKAKAQPDGLVSPPEKGILYHAGSYPGEKGSLVLVGDYQTLGAPLVETLQQNDEVQIVDRKGNIYTYKILSYPRLMKALSPTEASSPATPTSGTGVTAGLSGVYQTATALASSHATDQPMQVTSFDDFSILQLPTGLKPAAILTLVSLPKAGAGDPTRLVVRGILTGYRYVPLTPAGTPVVYSTPTPEPDVEAEVATTPGS